MPGSRIHSAESHFLASDGLAFCVNGHSMTLYVVGVLATPIEVVTSNLNLDLENFGLSFDQTMVLAQC